MSLDKNAEEVQSLGEKYFYQRIVDEMHITDAVNTVKLFVAKQVEYDNELTGGKSKRVENVLEDFKIFEPCDEGIAIRLYTLSRSQIKHANHEMTADGVEIAKRGTSKDYKLIRLHTPRVDDKGREHKYRIPKGAGTYPFIPPGLIDKYERKEKIKNLILTEGSFKAFVGWMNGFDIIGLTSIQHYKNKDTGTLHGDIIKLILECKVENVIWLADADANNISLKALEKGTDLYERPHNFFSSASTIRRLLSNYDVSKFFAYISPDLEGSPKGLDDMLLAFPGKAKEILDDLADVGKPARWFWREDMTWSADKIRKEFRLHRVEDFVEYHSEKIKKAASKAGTTNTKDLKNCDFIFNGTKYHWNESEGKCDIVVSKEVSKFFRVGDQYFEEIQVPNKYNDLENTFHKRQKSTIIDDHGKESIKLIRRFKAFCIVPDHQNFQPVHYGCYNMYSPFEHETGEGEITYTIGFLKHIFGDRDVRMWYKGQELVVNELDLGLDYIQLLYQQPQQMLPVLCLVSKENNTGKSTFAKWLRHFFGQNTAIVGNMDLASEFNGHWCGKLLVICDEAKIDKQIVIEKIKSLSTGEKVMMNQKGRDQVEMDIFAKFIFITNNEDNFIYATEEDQRFWVRKVPPVKELFVDMEQELREELPAFLNFLSKRKLKIEKKMHRAWIHPELLKTEALRKLIAYSQSTVEKELREHLRDMFFDHGVHEILMSLDDVHEHFLKRRYEKNYLRKTLTDKLKVDQYHTFIWDGVEYETMAALKTAAGDTYNADLVTTRYRTKRYSFPIWNRTFTDGKIKNDRAYVNGNGRPYVFKVEQFLTQQEIENRWIDPGEEAEIKMQLEKVDAGWSQTEAANASNGVGKQDDLPF